MNATEYPSAATVIFSRNFADIYAAATEGDQRRMSRSSELGFGYLASEFDSEAASNASAAMCHYWHAVNDEDRSAESTAYSLKMATSFADMARVTRPAGTR